MLWRIHKMSGVYIDVMGKCKKIKKLLKTEKAITKKPNNMKFILIITTVLFCSCSKFDSKGKDSNQISEHKIVYIDGNSEEYYSYYGMIVNNIDEHNFYCIDKKVMLKYIGNLNDTAQLKIDLKKAIWVSDIRSRSYDYYAWLNYLKTIPQNITLEYCDKNRRSSVTPVYLVEFNALMKTNLNNVDSCEGLHPLPYKIQSRPRVNMIFIEPLNYKSCEKYLELKDTLNRKDYIEFYKNFF